MYFAVFGHNKLEMNYHLKKWLKKHETQRICKLCGKPIRFVLSGESYWEHIEGKPRHRALPQDFEED